jgi:hypothetical protein
MKYKPLHMNFQFITFIASSTFISIFHLLRYTQGDFEPEEISQLIPKSGSYKLLSNYDNFNQVYPDGRFTNLIPFGVILGSIISNDNYNSIYIIQIYLTFLASFAVFKFLKIWDLNTITFIGAYLSIVFSFTFINTTSYQSKTYGICMFLIGFTIMYKPNTTPNKLKYLMVITALTYGVISNPATLITSLSFYFVYLLLSQDSLGLKMRRIVICLTFQLILYLPGVILYYLNENSFEKYISNLQPITTFFGNNLNILVGRGYWAESSTVDNDSRVLYFPWMKNYFEGLDNLRIFLVLLVVIISIFTSINRKKIERKFDFKIIYLTAILAYFIVAPEQWNLIFRAQTLTGIFNIWREPWSKFSLIFLVFLNLMVWRYIDDLHKKIEIIDSNIKILIKESRSNRFRKKKQNVILKNKFIVRGMRNELKGKKKVNLLTTILIVLPIIYLTQITIGAGSPKLISNDFYINKSSSVGSYLDITAMNKYLKSQEFISISHINFCKNIGDFSQKSYTEQQLFLNGIIIPNRQLYFSVGECTYNSSFNKYEFSFSDNSDIVSDMRKNIPGQFLTLAIANHKIISF